MKEARMGCGCAIIDDIIYVVGGLDNNNRALNSVEMFDTTTNTWKKGVLQLKSGRAGCVAISIEKSLYIVGGSLLIEVYNSEEKTWSAFLDEVCSQQYCLPSVSYSRNTGRLQVHGGATIDSIIPVLRTYDLFRKQWDSSESKLSTWGHGTAIAFGDTVLFVGGENLSENSVPLDSTMIYNLQNGSWKNNTIPRMSSGRSGCAAVTVEESLYVLGGHNESGVLKSVQVCQELKTYLEDASVVNTAPPPCSTLEDESTTCVVCMEMPRSHAFVPCGHLSLCSDCANKFPQQRRERREAAYKCPICRNSCSLIMKVYG
jgi:hypothetical protein